MTQALTKFLKMALTAAVAALLLHPPAQAQSSSCPPGDGTIEGLSKTVECLNEEVSAMAATLAVLQRSILDVNARAEVIGGELAGPTKEIELIPAKDNAVTKALVSKAEVIVFECAPLSAREGFTVFEAELGPDQPLGGYLPGFSGSSGAYVGKPGCSEAPHCRGRSKQVCKSQARTAGCYVNTPWLEWLRRQPGALVDYDTVCKP